MKKITLISILVFGLAISQAATDVSVPIGTAFSYQGRLMEANSPADGLYDFQFKLFDDPNVAFGNQLGSEIIVNELDVNDGYFTVELNFGDNVFNGSELWLEISVRRSISGGSFNVISPRQQITPAPYALYAASPSSDGFSDNDWQIVGDDMYAIPSGNVGIGTTTPLVPLDVHRSNPGKNQMVAAFVNPDNSPGTAATIALIVGSGMWPGGWTLTSNYASLDIDPISDMVFPSPVVTITSNRKVGIGTKDPITTLDITGTLKVASSNPGNNAVTGFFTNPSDAADSAVSIDLGIGTAAPSEWRLMAAHDSLNIGNAVVVPPAITIGSSHHVAISNGLSAGSSNDTAIRAGSGMIPMILITGKNGIVTHGEQYGIYAWGGQKAGWFSGDVYISGKVGIGTSEPQQKLHVAGIARFDLGGGNISMSTPGGWPGIISYSPNNHRRDIIVDDSSIRILTSSTSSAAPAENGITIRENGAVGIGTASPNRQLTIYGSGSAFQNVKDGTHELLMGVDDFGGIVSVYTDHDLVFRAGRNSEKMRIMAGGNVGIGTTSPTFLLHVNGSAGKPGGGSWASPSDVRLKVITGNYGRGLSEIVQLEPVRYSYKQDNEMGLPQDKEYVGVTAQDVEHAIPEAVSENEKGYLMVDNDPIIWAMVNAIKQLKAENDQLKVRLNALEQVVNKQKWPLQDMR